MKSRDNIILDLLNKELIEKNDIIFIKDRDATLTPILKRQRSQLSTKSREKKKKPKVLTLLSSKKEEKDKNSKEKDLEDYKL